MWIAWNRGNRNGVESFSSLFIGQGVTRNKRIIEDIKLQWLIVFSFNHLERFAELDVKKFCPFDGANKCIGFSKKNHFGSDLHRQSLAGTVT